MPTFLLGGMAVLVRAELQFDEAALGLSAGAFFATTAMVSVLGGRTAERIGARRGMVLAVTLSSVALLGAALFTRSWASLTAFMMLGGVGNGLGQPSANLALAQVVSNGRQGIAFGVKQSAIPMAGLVAGVSLPLIGLTLGWRWTFGMAALGLLVVVGIAPPMPPGRTPRARRGRVGDAPLAPLLVLALACMLGTMAAQSLGTFFVESTVSAGLAAGGAGVLLSLGSLTGIGVRLVSGWLADRREGRHLVVIAGMLAVGSSGFILLSLAHVHPGFVLAGTFVAFGLGWGWTGLLFLAVVRLNPNAPALASGITQMGGASGGVLGPLIFGSVVAGTSYRVAWSCAAVFALLASGLMLAGRRWLLLRRAGPRPDQSATGPQPRR